MPHYFMIIFQFTKHSLLHHFLKGFSLVCGCVGKYPICLLQSADIFPLASRATPLYLYREKNPQVDYESRFTWATVSTARAVHPF